ncbi:MULTISPECIES: YjjA family protein [Paraburkholderia]|uniref:DUF2501 domain-containing protein n=3 Tax=Paraburkholderia TaxID=1822464 RepID=A0A4Y8MTF9_9BURK|nr:MULTISPECIES: DUF2501 domain-containing protein [Paraburkholderia]ACD20607.1 conserved hypothetical protein [Paraburkholderia phytofirmans PsJN]TFE40593.1 DUF2501 domain-containing protein [Paraburkholderia dipogonis]
MIACNRRTWANGLLVATLLYFPTAHAQLGNLLNQGGNGAAAGGLGSLGGLGSGLSLQSLTSGSTGNVAGVLEFCIKNNYLGGGASSVKDGLMSKLPGGSSSSDSGYTDGAKGILNSGDGKQVDLSGGGLKEQITKQVCDKILAQGKSLL